jgi:hypothetical protein
MMKIILILLWVLTQVWIGLVAADSDPDDDIPIPVYQDGKYTLAAEGIRAQFVAYGASISNLFIKDTNGVERDIVLGYDNGGQYERDRSHPHLGGVPGAFQHYSGIIEFEILTRNRPVC